MKLKILTLAIAFSLSQMTFANTPVSSTCIPAQPGMNDAPCLTMLINDAPINYQFFIGYNDPNTGIGMVQFIPMQGQQEAFLNETFPPPMEITAIGFGELGNRPTIQLDNACAHISLWKIDLRTRQTQYARVSLTGDFYDDGKPEDRPTIKNLQCVVTSWGKPTQA